jgi:hypothetical protein
METARPRACGRLGLIPRILMVNMDRTTIRRTGVGNDNSLRSLSLGELLSAQLPARDYILEPLMKQGESLMLWAATGVGKTMVALSMALAAAGGGQFLGWKAPRPFRVLYIDGEMALADLQDRLRVLLGAVDGLDKEAASKNLRLIARSDQHPEAPFPDIAAEEGQKTVYARAKGCSADLVILDNFSVLAGIQDENDAAAMQPVLTFLLRMKQAGIATILVHHSGKSGEDYRGSSKIATTFEAIVGLKANTGAASRNATAFDLVFSKFRGKRNDTIVETTAWLEGGSDGELSWRYKESEDAALTRLVALVRSCRYPTQGDLAGELGVSTGKLSGLKTLCIGRGLIKADEWKRCMDAAKEMANDSEQVSFAPLDDIEDNEDF